MVERIKINEEKLDKVSDAFYKLESALDDFEKIKNDFDDLNNYYGSNDWFNDKDEVEKGFLKELKAGVLSEDAVWNLDENVKDLARRMNKIAEEILGMNKGDVVYEKK